MSSFDDAFDALIGWAATQYQHFNELVTRVAVLEKIMNVVQK